MSKTKQVRWNGGPQDPDFITQNGIVFNKGEWTSVPDDSDKDKDSTYQLKMDPAAVHGVRRPQKPLIHRLRDNPQFEVKGMDAEDHSSSSDNGPAALGGAPARAGVNTFRPVALLKGKKVTGWIIEGKNAVTGANVPGPTDEYADEASAQVVCDGLNQVAP